MGRRIAVEVSARHLHLTAEHFTQLFGKNASMTPDRALSQPGHFICCERIDAKGPGGMISGIAILGPPRGFTQLEISLTDARRLGLAVPVRPSGDISGSAGCTLTATAGTVRIAEGVIAAKRHLHMTPVDAQQSGVSNGDLVSVKLFTARSVTFHDVLVRVDPAFRTVLHIDTDEGNAAGCVPGESYCEIVRLTTEE